MDEASGKTGKAGAGTSTLDMALRVLEFLSGQDQPMTLAQIAKAFSANKATVYRHLVTLQRHDFVRQDPETSRYEAGIKLLMLGEAVRNRFQVATAARDELSALRERTGQAVTICGLVDNKLVVLDLLHGRTVIEFGTRPGTELSVHATAHGKVWLAFGAASLMDQTLAAPLHVWTPKTITDPARLQAEAAEVRAKGWAIAADELLTAVNALAAPVFNHRGEITGSVAIVGSTQFIGAPPEDAQVNEVLATARRISERLGWREQQ
ncbi:IclR family transcriptional regulator [Brucella haematophila]|uniref:IclR family transcriptional regulator n=1 Tax=Brucella haematophila TaxID=419474 RepID=UPI00110EC3AC|nr:IclR family transcriptional regulator [Brucella haematophila]TMV04353.1 IclR family transcriptional regulator [Brucella haematophila]